MGVYFSERALKTVFWSRLKIYIIIFFLFIFLGGVFYAVSSLEIFKVKSLEVTGNTSVEQGEIINAVTNLVLRNSFIGRFLGAGNILVWSNRRWPDETIKEFPQVFSLGVKRDLFSRKVVIEVKERDKKMIWCLIPESAPSIGGEEKCFWSDETGFLFGKAPTTEGQLVEVIKEKSSRSLNIGDYLLEEKEMENLNKSLKFLGDLNLSSDKIKINEQKFKELTALIKGGSVIYFSLLADPSSSKAAVESLLKSGRSIDYLDLRVEGKVYYKYR